MDVLLAFHFDIAEILQPFPTMSEKNLFLSLLHCSKALASRCAGSLHDAIFRMVNVYELRDTVFGNPVSVGEFLRDRGLMWDPPRKSQKDTARELRHRLLQGWTRKESHLGGKAGAANEATDCICPGISDQGAIGSGRS
jgi:hypothetical protein